MGLPREPERADDLGVPGRLARRGHRAGGHVHQDRVGGGRRRERRAGRCLRRGEARGRRSHRRRGLSGRPRGHRAGRAARADLDRLPDRGRARRDLVKTFHTGARFAEIVRSTPVPILALGAQKLPREVDALELAATAMRMARGGSCSGATCRGSQPGAVPGGAPEVVKLGVEPRRGCEVRPRRRRSGTDGPPPRPRRRHDLGQGRALRRGGRLPGRRGGGVHASTTPRPTAPSWTPRPTGVRPVGRPACADGGRSGP